MRETVQKTILEYKMITHADGIVVGLSGGADSVALLHVLLELHEELGIIVYAVHVNHNLRGVESDSDEKFVRKMCETLGVTLKIYQANVNDFADEKKLGTEEAARKLRYEFLEKARIEFAAERSNASYKIAVGHNLDDNAETVVMNLCRGAGLKGLGGILPVNGSVIRPLLEVSRVEIEEYLGSAKIEFITDSSNSSNEFTRNRVRNIIMPLLKTEINPNVKTTIARSAELLRCDEDFLEMAAQDAFAECAEKISDIRLNISKLAAFPPALSRRVIRIAISQFRYSVGFALNDITSAHIASVIELAHAQTGREIHLPGVIVAKEYEYLFFYASARPSVGFIYDLKENSSTYIPEIKKTVVLSFSASIQPHCTKTFRYDKITKSLVLRTRRPGDKITLKSGDGRMFTKKLQDYFTDEKIPKSQRDGIPLIVHGNEILWILCGKNRVNAKFEAFDENIKKNKKCIWISLEGET